MRSTQEETGLVEGVVVRKIGHEELTGVINRNGRQGSRQEQYISRAYSE